MKKVVKGKNSVRHGWQKFYDKRWNKIWTGRTIEPYFVDALISGLS